MSEVDDKKISGDRPITNPDGDILGYKTIAKHLADRIMTAADPEGFTIAIYGEWGSGKTSLLNMTNFFLGEREKSEQPIVVPFNPWWFSGHEELAREFFIALRTGLESQPGIGEAVRVALNSLGNLVSYIPYEQVARLGKGLSELTSKSEKTVPQLKTEISNELRKLGRTIVVTIDDLDRLTAEEIRQVFRVVKAVADFPNVIYLMAFDQEIVAKALSDPNGLSGKSFLEKIVQVPIALPAIDRTALKKMLFKQLDELEPNPDPARFDATHWGNVFLDGIEPLLATPRHVVRLINALRFTYPAVREEVNFVDFVAVETLRIFCPKAHELVKDNPEMFLRTATHGQASEKELADALDPVLADAPNRTREAITAMLQRLFPRLESCHGPSFESTWRRSARICSAERFPIYFRLSLPVEEFSAAELKSIFALLRTSSKDFGRKLVQYTEEILPDGSSRARILLDRLQDYTQETLSLSEASNLALALFDVGDQLLREEDKQGDFFEIGNKIRVGRIVYQVLRRFEEPERFGILSNALRKGAAVNLAAYQIAIFGQEHGKHGARGSIPEQQQILNAPHIKELEDLAVQKIRAAATDGALIKVPELNHVLHLWSELGDESEVRMWVEGVLANDEDLIKVLEGFLITSKSQVLTDRVGKLDYRLDPEWLKPYVDPDTVIERCRKILKSKKDLSVRQKTALSEFARAYDLRKAGKDPDPLM